jgi:hypothetical protein
MGSRRATSRALDDPLEANLRMEDARKFVTCLCRDQQGCVWVGCEEDTPGTGGVQRFDPSAPELHQWTQFTTKNGLSDNSCYAIACDHKGRIWCGTLNHGLDVYNGNTWQNYEVVGGLSRPCTLSGPLGERVFAIKVCPTDGDVWTSTNCGLSRYSESKDTWSYYTRADGLPSDQSNAIAFDKNGNIYTGTQCDGIAMANAADNYKAWRVVTGPDQLPTIPVGDGLPTNLINDVLVARDGAVYVATDAGLASSKDSGQTWKFVRGKDWVDKVRGLTGGPPKGWKPLEGRTLAEDYCACLAEAAGVVWVGHREEHCEVIGPDGQSTVDKHVVDFVRTMLPCGDDLLLGCYGTGLEREPMALDAAAAQSAGTKIDAALPSGAAVPGSSTLRAATQSLEHLPRQPLIACYLGDDWATRGDWVARYGRQHNVLCGAMSPFDQSLIWDNIYDISGHLGQHHMPNDTLRAWLHWAKSTKPNVLYDPIEGVRRQSEWDDHGESVPAAFEGPDVWISVSVPAGIQRVSLYFMNKDGHRGRDRFRDYSISLFKGESSVASDTARMSLARARLDDFWGGVYKTFLVAGPGNYQLRIDKNYSYDTIVSAVFVDRQLGPSSQFDAIPFAWLGGVDYRAPNILAIPHEGLAYDALKLWVTADNSFDRAGIATLITQSRLLAFRAASADPLTPPSLLDNWRWMQRLWTPRDRREFAKAMDDGWRQQITISPQMVWEQRTALSMIPK